MAADKRAARLGVLAVVAALLLGAIGTRLWFLQTVDAESLQADVDTLKTKTVPIVPQRGRIFDVDGRLLADNERMLTVAVDWAVLRRDTDRAEIFRRLSGWLEMPIEEMEARYDAGRYSRYLPLPLKEDVDESVAIALQERVEDLPGVSVVEDSRRIYPYAPLASHIVGYLGAITEEDLDHYLDLGYERNEIVGRAGVELSMENLLHGQWGEIVYEVDAANRVVRTIRVEPPVDGFDIQLSIDLDLQQYAEQILQTQLRNRRTFTAANRNVKRPDGTVGPMDPYSPARVAYSAPAGSVVVMNQETGQIAAMASYPTFDNRWFGADIPPEKFAELFPPNERDPDKAVLTNRAIQGQYNLGSTYKLATAYAALNSGLIGSDTYYNDTGTYRLQRVDQDLCATARCEFSNAFCASSNGPCVYGSVNVMMALAVSSDAFFYKLGEDFYWTDEELMAEQMRQLGFGRDTGIDLPYEYDGRVPDDKSKARLVKLGVLAEGEVPRLVVGDNIQTAIGQGLLAATPLQLARGYAAVANGGRVLRPRVVQAIWEPGTPDGMPGFVNLKKGEIHRVVKTKAKKIPMSDDVRGPIMDGLRRNVTGPGFNGRSTTAEELFAVGYPDSAIPVAGKTGTAQGAGNFSWNDSSAFAAMSLDPERPWTVASYLEKAGAGSQGAAPVVKCLYLALSELTPLPPVNVSDPLDVTSDEVAPSMPNADKRCMLSSNPGTVRLD
jgi:penicillin-binding protein 2